MRLFWKPSSSRLTRLTVLGAVAVGVVAGIGQAAPDRSTAKPRSVSPPTIEGNSFREGSSLWAGNGLWANNPTRFTYRWDRCDANGAGCVSTGVTSRTYRLRRADVGRTMMVLVTASNRDGSATANSKPSPVIAANAPPANTSKPTISGTARVGESLTANPGTWTNSPTSFAYQWQSCDENGANCASVAGATSQLYGVRTADVDRRLRVLVTARTPAGASTAASDLTAPVRPPAGTVQAVSVTRVSLPDRLIISGVQFIPRTIGSRDEPLTARFRITDTRGRIVQGALVYAIGVPANRVSFEGERATDAAGWATFTF